MKSKVLITGGAGFTGRYLVKELEGHGYETVVPPPHPSADFNLTDFSSVKKFVETARPDAVIHLAGLAFVGASDALEFYRVNVLGTENLLRAVAGLPVQKVILASTSNVYGNTRDSELDEKIPLAPVSHYAISKMAMEMVARTWSDRISIVLTRPFNYTGVGQEIRYVIPKIVEHFRQRTPTVQLGNIDVYREFNDVRQVATMYRLLLERALPGTTVNLCTGVEHSLRDIVANLERLSGHTLRIEVNPEFVRKNEIERLRGNPSFLKAQIGDFVPVPLEDTLRWMLEGEE
jgi:nucleoside-diphosphate-sugar epimerase